MFRFSLTLHSRRVDYYMRSNQFNGVCQHEEEMTNSQGTPERRVATIDEVAKILRLSRVGAYAAAKRGDLPTIKIGRRILVPLAALERMLGGNV
jgi:excisionase family DNA binding protein